METNKLFALTLPVVAVGIWMAKRNPIPPPQDRWTAPTYGNYSFPDTSYLQGYSPFYWSYANDLTALIMVRAIRQDLAGEEEAASTYAAHADATNNRVVKDILESIADEGKVRGEYDGISRM